MKRIALIYLGRRGGGSIYSFEMARSLAKENKVLAILSFYAENRNDWELEAENNENLDIIWIRTYQTLIQCVFSFFRFGMFRSLIKRINKWQPDILYSPMSFLWEFIIYPFIKVPMKVKTIHDVVLHDGEAGILRKFFHFFSFKQANKYVILSGVFEEHLWAKGIKSSDIIVIPHAVFDFYRKCASTSEPISEEFKLHNKILFFGRIIQYKGLGVLLNAMEVVRSIYPQLKLVVVGSGEVESYQESFEKLGGNLELHIEWVSNEDVERYFEDVDFIVLPYTQASQSGVIPLAYGFKKPVVATAVGGIPGQVVHERTGLLVPPGDAAALADAIVHLYSDPKLIKSMGENSVRFVEEEMSWSASAKKLMQGAEL